MNGRDDILAKIRKATIRGVDDADRRATVLDRLRNRPAGPIPARGRVEGEARLALFTQKAQAVSCDVRRLATLADVPATIAAELRARNLPQAIRHGADPVVAAVPFAREPQLSVSLGPSDGRDAACLTRAVVGIAETGTVMTHSGPDNPTTLNFLPELHVVLLAAADVLGDFESAWARLRALHGDGVMPRSVTLITGPSRSGDIEQTILLGAHGPRSVVVLLIDDLGGGDGGAALPSP